MTATTTQRRAFITLICRMAWADGIVTDEERAAVIALANRFGGEDVSSAELDRWLNTGELETVVGALPDDMNMLVIYEATQLMAIDGEVDERERVLLDELMRRIYEGHKHETPLARVALAKRQGRI